MPRVLFTEDFIYKPVAQQTFVYKKGDVLLVKQEVADKAISKNKAKLTEFEAPPSSISDTIRRFPNRKKRLAKEEDVVAAPSIDATEIATSLDE